MNCFKNILFLFGFILLIACNNKAVKIDRYALVNRHSITISEPDIESVFSVGNGEMAFNVGITGLQTFPGYYSKFPVVTLSQWGWHSFPNSRGYTLADVSEEMIIRGEKHRYPSVGYSIENPTAGLDNPAYQYLNKNPHKFNLGCIGFDYQMSDGKNMEMSDVKEPSQKLDLWNGTVHSDFTLDDKRVEVKTFCHPYKDIVAVQVQSELLKQGRLGFSLKFPFVDPDNYDPSDWDSPEKHKTIISKNDGSRLRIYRKLDSTNYQVTVSANSELLVEAVNEHEFRLSFSGEELSTAELLFSFSPRLKDKIESFSEVEQLNQSHWNDYWTNGGAIDFSGSLDPRAKELERRIVLSQYLTAVHCSGSLPPQESGLVHNSWYGKFHLEMHWWHAAHFALWGHPDKLENSLDWYLGFLEDAKKLAGSYGNGNTGARWPKMIGPEGRETPNKINPFIMWQQPHIIYMCELLYRANPSDSVLNKYKELVFETANFLADFAFWDEKEQRYFIGPPIQPMEELHSPELNYNPTCELAYWDFGLKTALKWRERLGLGSNDKWEHVISNLSALPTVTGYNNNPVYVSGESEKGIWENCKLRKQHPSFLWAKGVIPGDKVDDKIMKNTLYHTRSSFNFNTIWGWDPPMMAMAASRIGEPEWAVDLLFATSRNNNYNKTGHCQQWNHIPAYLPANGGVLLASALMTAGWDGSGAKCPGFPKNDLWKVKYENILPLP